MTWWKDSWCAPHMGSPQKLFLKSLTPKKKKKNLIFLDNSETAMLMLKSLQWTLRECQRKKKKKKRNTWFWQTFLSPEEAGLSAIWSAAMFCLSFSPVHLPVGRIGPGWQQIAATPALQLSWDSEPYSLRAEVIPPTCVHLQPLLLTFLNSIYSSN